MRKGSEPSRSAEPTSWAWGAPRPRREHRDLRDRDRRHDRREWASLQLNEDIRMY